MNRKLEKIVSDFQLNQKREDYFDDKNKIFKDKCAMSQLTMNREVGQYAFNLDEYFYYINLLKKNKSEKIYKKLDELYFKIRSVENEKDILEYRNLRDEIKSLDEECKKLFKLINIDLREKLIYNEIPCIFVYQGCLGDNIKYSRNILNPKLICGYTEDFDTVIYPEYELKSNRELRHFYNRVSFKYLDEITRDFSYDLDGKELGKVRIIKK